MSKTCSCGNPVRLVNGPGPARVIEQLANSGAIREWEQTWGKIKGDDRPNCPNERYEMTAVRPQVVANDGLCSRCYQKSLSEKHRRVLERKRLDLPLPKGEARQRKGSIDPGTISHRISEPNRIQKRLAKIRAKTYSKGVADDLRRLFAAQKS